MAKNTSKQDKILYDFLEYANAEFLRIDG